MFNYDKYNREERAICAHLFRLLHEKLENKQTSPLGQFLDKLFQSDIEFRNRSNGANPFLFENVGIFCEVAIIRDAYKSLKPDVNPLMDSLTKLLMTQANVTDCRLYSELPEPLRNTKLTHPKQIRLKATTLGVELSEGEAKVYGAMQGMFNAKPDLAICIDNKLIVFEAKFTEAFDPIQMMRTWNIAEVWTTLLYKEFGFTEPPEYSVVKLGGSKCSPHISWADTMKIASDTYHENDRTLITLKSGVDYLKQTGFE